MVVILNVHVVFIGMVVQWHANIPALGVENHKHGYGPECPHTLLFCKLN